MPNLQIQIYLHVLNKKKLEFNIGNIINGNLQFMYNYTMINNNKLMNVFIYSSSLATSA